MRAGQIAISPAGRAVQAAIAARRQAASTFAVSKPLPGQKVDTGSDKSERLVSVFDVDVCEFCNQLGPDRHKCAWKVEKELHIGFAELQPGDKVRRIFGPPNTFLIVESVTFSQDRRTVFFTVRGNSLPLTASLNDKVLPTFLGLRRVPCGAVCCELCSAERAEDVHICADHWRLIN
jgi:hypothetical protein